MAELDLKNYKNRHSLKSKIARALWNVVWLLLFRPTPRGNLFRPWRIALLKLFCAKVRWSSNVLPSCRIWQPWKLTMGPCVDRTERYPPMRPTVFAFSSSSVTGYPLATLVM